ncbi:SIS domain-containing protein [Bacillus massilinigeriensis]|uniref:SIS domain-containing protein n=1 Tax=Bacillus massilionigeriensis TaxID=1805475 RepID=UPI00096AE4CC|nr:SIS domain-containing protein [Bacillus massilionigeriensis]
MFESFIQKIQQLISLIQIKEKENIKKAAQKISDCIQQDGVIHVFGCGHSHMLGEELFYRAGGLVPINPILVEELMLHKGAFNSSKLEQTNDYAKEFMNEVQIKQGDIVIVTSTSGRNPVPIDVALLSKKKGAFVIAITSPKYAENQTSRHVNGQFLFQTADLTIDNHIEVGDVLLKSETEGMAFGSGSSIIGMTILNGIIVEAIDLMLQNHFSPPIFKSSNTDGAGEHNQKLVEKYKNRIPLLLKEK